METLDQNLRLAEFRLIGFDLDGTLYPSTDEIQKRIRGLIYERISTELGIPESQAEKLFEELYNSNHSYGYSGSRTIEEIGRRFNKSLEGSEIVQESVEQANIVDLIDPNPQLAETLERLARRIQIDLITSSQYTLAIQKLSKIGIYYNTFSNLFAGKEKGSKTAGTVYDYWISLTGIPPNQTLYIGDNPKQDIDSPKKLGIKTCIVHRKHDNADYHLPTINDLERLLQD